MPKDKSKPAKQSEQKKHEEEERDDDRVSLFPLSFEEAMDIAIRTPYKRDAEEDDDPSEEEPDE
jgi:hypothetical protein